MAQTSRLRRAGWKMTLVGLHRIAMRAISSTMMAVKRSKPPKLVVLRKARLTLARRKSLWMTTQVITQLRSPLKRWKTTNKPLLRRVKVMMMRMIHMIS